MLPRSCAIATEEVVETAPIFYRPTITENNTSAGRPKADKLIVFFFVNFVFMVTDLQRQRYASPSAAVPRCTG